MHQRTKIKKAKKQPIEWETIFSNHVFSKGLESRIHKEFTQQWKDNPIFFKVKDLNKYFSKEHIQMAKKHMKKNAQSPLVKSNLEPQWDTTPHPLGWL